MKPSEYFERYGRDSHIEFFRGEDLPAGVPNRIGIYAWYGRVLLSDPDRARGTTASGLESLLHDHVFVRFQRQPYRVLLQAGLEPRFRGSVRHEAQLPGCSGWDDARSGAATSSVFNFFARSFAPGFSAPIYVGKAVGQPLSSRVAQHLAGIREYMGRTPEFLQAQREALVDGDADEEERDAHSFAIEAAARRFSPERLVLVTYSPPETETVDVGFLEAVVNRVSYPICGRR